MKRALLSENILPPMTATSGSLTTACRPVSRGTVRRGVCQPHPCYGCGQGIAALAGLCRSCYRARAHSRSRFEGHREDVLERDGRRCRTCGAAQPGCRLHVHHRKPGVHDPQWLIVLCAGCHARIHRLLRFRVWLPESLIELWAEQHPELPLQLQFPLAA
jgi:hypothetical protein